jgi:hypothetical protein
VGRERWREEGWGLTDEEGAGERPPLRARDDGEGEPVRGDEGVQQRHRGDAPDRGRLLSGPPQPAQPAAAVHHLAGPVSSAPPPPGRNFTLPSGAARP